MRWQSPIALREDVAIALAALLGAAGTPTLTLENVERVAQLNQRFGVIYGARAGEYANAEELKPLVGFSVRR